MRRLPDLPMSKCGDAHTWVTWDVEARRSPVKLACAAATSVPRTMSGGLQGDGMVNQVSAPRTGSKSV